MESNVFDVVSVTSSSSHCPLSLVPCPPLKSNPKGVHLMELTLKVELHIPECRPKWSKKVVLSDPLTGMSAIWISFHC